jgi:hypothetical protein
MHKDARVVCISGRHKSRFIQTGIYYGVGGRSAYPTFSRALCMIISSSKLNTIRACYIPHLLSFDSSFDSYVALPLVRGVVSWSILDYIQPKIWYRLRL